MAMPSAPAVDQLQDTYTNGQCADHVIEYHAPREEEKNCALHQMNNGTGKPRFFSQQQQQLLANTAVQPTDYYLDNAKNENGPPSGFLPVAVAVESGGSPLLVTDEGVPLYHPSNLQPSTADTSFDGYKGVSSSDELLFMDKSGEEILKFLNTFNSKPKQLVRVHGFHYETRTREIQEEDDDGNIRWRTEHYEEFVTDFDYRVDISDMVFPYGYIATTEGTPVPNAIDDFLLDHNCLKQLVMDKVIDFDFYALEQMVVGHIRQSGWWRGLDVSFPRANNEVRVWKKTCISTVWESCLGKCLCYVSIIGCCIIHCIRSNHSQSRIKSYFKIDYHPLQLFEFIKSQLWCPSFGNQAVSFGCELLREGFW